MRKISNTLAIENLFNDIPSLGDPSLPPGSGSVLLKAFSEKVLHPVVSIVAKDCNTRLGKKLVADKDLIGTTPIRDLTVPGTSTVLVEEGQLIYQSDLERLDGLLNYYTDVRVRSLDSCVAVSPEGKEGACSECLRASAKATYEVNVPAAEDMIDFDAGFLPVFWYLEDVRNNRRQTYVVYYSRAGDTSLPDLADISEKPTSVSSLPIKYVRVELVRTDSPEEVAEKTSVALNAVMNYQNKRAFWAGYEEGTVGIKHTYLQDGAVTNPPYMNPVGTPYSVPGLTISTFFAQYVPGSSVRLSFISTLGFYSRLIEAHSGALVGLANILPTQLPYREQLFRSLVSENDVSIAYRELVRKVSDRAPADLLTFVEELPDRLDRALMIITVYSMYSFMR